jgi:hypothetical protein
MFSINDSLHIAKLIKLNDILLAGVTAATGAGCVDSYGTFYLLGSDYTGTYQFIQQNIPTNVRTFIHLDFVKYSYFSFAVTDTFPQRIYAGVANNYTDVRSVLIIQTVNYNYTVVGSLNFGTYTLAYPTDIKFDTSGGIYVADYTQGVFYFATESSVATLIPAPLAISEIAVDSQNHIYAIQPYYGNAYCITTGVTYSTPSDINFFTFPPRGICVDSNFNVYVNYSFGDKIVKYYENGRYFYTITLPYNSQAMYIDMKGFDDLYMWSTYPQLSVYKSVIEIGKVTRVIRR